MPLENYLAPLQQFVQPTLVHTSEQPSSKILNLYGTKELGIRATRCSGVRVPDFFCCVGSPMQGTGARCSNSCLYTGFGIHSGRHSAISSMLLNLCMYTPVNINLLSSKHYRYVVAVIFTFLIKCSIYYL